MRKIIYLIILAITAEILPATSLHAATISVPGNYGKIQDAVDKASPGDTILVDEGSYDENVSITKPLSIKSSKGPAVTKIRALVKNDAALKISNTSDVTLSGFTATGSDVAGILLLNARNVILSGNVSKQNGSGIVLNHSSDNTLADNESNLNSNYGLYLEASSGNKLSKNAANSNNNTGIFISHSNKNHILDNNANRNRWNGIMLFSSHGNTVYDNRTIGNSYGLVTSDSDDNDMGSNTALPNIFIILPIVLIYVGIMSYLLQKAVLRLIYRG